MSFETYLMESGPLKTGPRYYAGTKSQMEDFHDQLVCDFFWRHAVQDGNPFSPVQVLDSREVNYGILRFDYLDLDGNLYKLRARQACLRYLWVRYGSRFFRMVKPQFEDLLWDRYDSPHGWRELGEHFFGLPGVFRQEAGILCAQVYCLDESFSSRQEAEADILTPPPAVNLQCALDEIFSPV